MKNLLVALFFVFSHCQIPAYAGTNNLPVESARVIQLTHVNKFQTAFSGDMVPRDSSGNINDGASNLGLSSNRWLSTFTKNLSLTYGLSTNPITLTAPNGVSSPYTLTFPTALPSVNSLYVLSNTGQLSYRNSDPNYTVNTGGNETGIFTTTNTSMTLVTNSSITLTTTGRPVLIGMNGESTASTPYLSCLHNSATTCKLSGEFRRDGVKIAPIYMEWDFGSSTTNFIAVPLSSIVYVDFTASAASHTYTLYISADSGSTVSVSHGNMFAVEL